MRRSLLFGLVVILVGLGVGLWWMGRGSPYPAQQHVRGLSDSTSIRWSPEGHPTIEADSALDALTALGYVHGLRRGWTVVLWRQTALGRLSRWFGSGVGPIDRHARRLGLARHARTAYNQLSEADQERLRAYSSGLTAALRSPAVRRSDPFVLFDVTPDQWAPWHTLLIERLLAWMATRPLSPPASAPAPVTQFCETDRQFRRWLHLHGWTRSVAWAVRPSDRSSSSSLFQRHVLGASAAPIIQETSWQRPQGSPLTWATFPGTLIFSTGMTQEEAWGALLHSPAHLDRIRVDSSSLQRWYERLSPVGGDEWLLQLERLGNTLPLGLTAGSFRADRDSPDSAPDSVLAEQDSVPRPAVLPDSLQPAPDTAWVIRWPGFSSKSDIPAWLSRGRLSSSSSAAPSFGLFEADGLRISADGGWSVLGTPTVVERTKTALLVGNSQWAHSQAQALFHQVQSSDSIAIESWSESDSSVWAARLSAHADTALRRFAASNSRFQKTVIYLQNWGHHYSSTSIGALLFEAWMRAYRTDIGPVPTPADTSVFFASYRQRKALLRALDTLRAEFGPDVRRWRWGNAISARRYFPVWSADSLINTKLPDLETTRYGPLNRTDQGHPSTPLGGPSLVDPLPVARAPDRWEGWMQPGKTMTVRRHRYDPDAFLAHSRLKRGRPSPKRLSTEKAAEQTLLLPAE